MVTRESHFQIAAVLEQIPAACNFVAGEARAAGLDENAAYHCQLAVDEACTNIVEHGYKRQDINKTIDIYCRKDNSRFFIAILDDSPAFNPLAQPDPNPSASLEDRPVGGWGIHFIRKLMDEVSYTHAGNRNRLLMMKRLQ